MQAGVAVAFAMLRIPRGNTRPSEDELLEALRRDREQLHQPALNHAPDYLVAGPYHVTVDGKDLDEWVVWER